MSMRRFSSIGIIVLFTLPAIFAEASPRPANLGKVEFPTSGSREAQPHFLTGVAALHSFWYDEALEAFRRAVKLDPGFIMGYWGAAMAHNRSLWDSQDAKGAKGALVKITDGMKATDRERAYLGAVKLLYGDGDKPSRDAAYSNAMQKIHRDHPEDMEAACFYALSLLATAQNSDREFQLRIQAGAITLEVFRKNADHPCAAHYTIHAFDHPDLAVLALPAARRYAGIAPASHHAQHMPAHIFLQLGMWPEAAASNEGGWQNSVDWVERKGLPRGKRDYHSLQWLHYAYLQQGRYKKASEVFQLKLKDMLAEDGDAGNLDSKIHRRVGKYYARMAGASVFERERWKSAAALDDPPGWKPGKYAKASILFVRGFAAAMQGRDKARRYLAELNAIRAEGFEQNHFERLETLAVWDLEIRAAINDRNKNHENAIALMKQAAAMEEKLPPPSGPPHILKPTYELFGEILLRAGKPKEAARQFSISLLRHPNRTRSLLGAARADAAVGDEQGAIKWYSKFLASWKQADSNLPESSEARNYLKKTSSP